MRSSLGNCRPSIPAMTLSCSWTWAASGWVKMVRMVAATISADPLGTRARRDLGFAAHAAQGPAFLSCLRAGLSRRIPSSATMGSSSRLSYLLHWRETRTQG
jgi:hypothetical protein